MVIDPTFDVNRTIADMTKLEAALFYASRGLKIFPVRDDCIGCTDSECGLMKAPHPRLLGKGENSWSARATNDSNQVSQWWEQYPNAQIGLPLRLNELVAVDIDNRPVRSAGKPRRPGLKYFQKIRGSSELGQAAIQGTPGGQRGNHIIYRRSGDGRHIKNEIRYPASHLDEEDRDLIEANRQDVSVGIDIKYNGYILLPPSTQHGKPYEWAENRSITEQLANLDELPEWLHPWVFGDQRSVTADVGSNQRSDMATLLRHESITEEDRKLVREALACVPPDVPHDAWVKVGMALHDAGFDVSVWDDWSRGSKQGKYKSGECQERWRSFRRRGTTIATIFHYAKQHGFRFPRGHFQRTDSSNADRLAILFGHLMRWYPVEQKHLVWNDINWQSDNTERPIAYAKETAQMMFAEADDNDELKWAATSASGAKIKAMLELAKPNLAVTEDMLDSDPFLLNCTNGTIDLRTGILLPHTQEDFITKVAPVAYDPNAIAPRFEQFLHEIFQGSKPLIEFVQRALGSSLTGAVTDQKLFVPYGHGANGKSTLINAVSEILGSYAYVPDPALLINQQKGGASEETYRLRGIRFAPASESNEENNLNEAVVKRLTGGDPLTCRPLWGHLVTFNPTHKLWLITNHRPQIKSQGHAIWRRIALIPFDVQIPDDRKDRDLGAKLKAEYPGILSWLVKGCLKWQQDGLCEPEEVKRATAEYKDEQDALSVFIAECCYLGEQANVQASLLRKAYQGWCRNNGEPELNKNAFPVRLVEKGFVNKGSSGNKNKVWWGIGLKSLQEQQPKPSLREMI
jgi:P4 family phage/plasmid primase-like protien